ncbi:MAG: hypothetical protein WDA71_07535 [Actinomycetota bacterium]
MRASAFFPADHAEAVNGKLYVTGGCWDRILATAIPGHHPHLSLAAVLHVNWNETDQRHAVQVEGVDEDGRQFVSSIEGQFQAGRPPGMRPGDESAIVMVFNLDGMPLRRAGVHEFVLRVDGQELARARFRAVPAEQRATTG